MPSVTYATTPEALVVRLAGSGDQRAFEELVRRRQSWVRNLMRRLSRDDSLADDLAQQVFIRVWQTIAQLQDPLRFPGWLKRMAINVWLQHHRKLDVLAASETLEGREEPMHDSAGMAVDLDRALASLAAPVRLCVVLSYHAEMSHAEIADATSMPLGTVKSHIRRGTERLEALLSAYVNGASKEAVS